MCEEVIGSFPQCRCVEGWDSADCSVPDCVVGANQCLNGGSCVETPSEIQCLCSSDWTGYRCQIAKSNQVSGGSDSGLHFGAIIGIVLGAVLMGVLMAVMAASLSKWKEKQNTLKYQELINERVRARTDAAYVPMQSM